MPEPLRSRGEACGGDPVGCPAQAPQRQQHFGRGVVWRRQVMARWCPLGNLAEDGRTEEAEAVDEEGPSGEPVVPRGEREVAHGDNSSCSGTSLLSFAVVVSAR